MKNVRLLLVAALLMLSVGARAWDYKSEESETVNAVQLRTAFDMDKSWHNGLKLNFSEELRFDVYNSLKGPSFKTSYTTLSLQYQPVKYVKMDLGYTLKINGPGSTWSDAKRSDANRWIRHRGFVSVTGAYQIDFVKLSLRERVLMEARTDSVNPLEKNKLNWQLRSRLCADFSVPGKPVKPYVWVELINTLNAPEYQQKNGHQFISDVRTQAGVKWRLTRMSSLDFFYRFTYGYDRDINVTRKKGYIELTETTLYQHAIGISYNLDW